jgi:cobalt-zinc-cadmium efflux system protein
VRPRRDRRQNLAVEGSFQHLRTDLYAFIGTAVAAIIIITTGSAPADPIASLFVAGSMLWAAYGLLKDSGRVLLEMSPKGMDVDAFGNAPAPHPHVASVHEALGRRLDDRTLVVVHLAPLRGGDHAQDLD